MWRRQVRALRRARCSCHVSSVHCRFSSVLQRVGLRGSGGWKRPNAIVHLTFQLECHRIWTVSFLSEPRDLICLVLWASIRSLFLKGGSRSIPRSVPACRGRLPGHPACHCGLNWRNDHRAWHQQCEPKLLLSRCWACWVIVAQWKVHFLGCSKSFIHKSSVRKLWNASKIRIQVETVDQHRQKWNWPYTSLISPFYRLPSELI